MKAGIVVALSLVAASAHADNKAWTAGKKILPAGQAMVVVANFAAIHDSQLFQTMWPAFLAQHKDASNMLGKTKSTCGIDPMQAIDSVVLAMPSVDGNSDNAAFVVSLKGATQKEVDSCITKLEKAETGNKVTISTDGGITKYDTGGDAIYMRWIDKNTVVFSAAGKDQLVKMTKGGLGGDKTLGTAIGGLKGDAALSLIFTGPIPVDQVAPGAKATLAYGNATLKNGTVGVDVHVVMDSAKSSADVATKASGQLALAKGALPQQYQALVNSVAIKSVASELVITASSTEKDVVALIQAAL